jgi:hypothetical protein
MLSFRREIELVWLGRIRFSTLLYFATRYLPVAYFVFAIVPNVPQVFFFACIKCRWAAHIFLALVCLLCIFNQCLTLNMLPSCNAIFHFVFSLAMLGRAGIAGKLHCVLLH